MARVCLYQVSDSVAEAVDACFAGVVPHQFLDGVKQALVKPNLVNHFAAETGVTTSLEIVSQLVTILKERGVEKVVVGESALTDTHHVFNVLGLSRLEALGAEVVNFDRDSWEEVASPHPLVLGRFHLPRVVLESDLIISAAKMKAHNLTRVTLSMKNLLGALSPYHRKVGHRTDIHSAIVEVYAYLKASKKLLAFVDAIYALEGRLSPSWGHPLKLGLVLSGDDFLATDATCARIMGQRPLEVKHLQLAHRLGLGSLEAELHGVSPSSVTKKFDIPSETTLLTYVAPRVQERLFKKLPFLAYTDRCDRCGKCIRACPGGYIYLENGLISIDHRGCLSCLVCCEACPQGALDYRVTHSTLYGVVQALWKGYRRWKGEPSGS